MEIITLEVWELWVVKAEKKEPDVYIAILEYLSVVKLRFVWEFIQSCNFPQNDSESLHWDMILHKDFFSKYDPIHSFLRILVIFTEEILMQFSIKFSLSFRGKLCLANLLRTMGEKCANLGFFLVHIFLYSDWIQEIRTRKNYIFGLFMQWYKYAQLCVPEAFYTLNSRFSLFRTLGWR